MKIVAKTFYWLIIFSVFAFSGLATFSKIAGPGNFRLLAVESGSMEPAIKSGSVILVLPKNQTVISPLDTLPKFQKGEVITFLAGRETITHRITEIVKSEGKIFYKTKGDANKGEDVGKVAEENVLGKVVFSLPYLGFLVSFAKTQAGFIFLIVIPATIIVWSEILNIREEIKKMFLRKKLSEV
jgi:signal peptidase